VPLIAERGYHVVIPGPSLGIRASLMPSDGQMGVVSTPQGLRLAGPVELAAPTAAPDWRRAEILLGYARKMFPELAPRFDAASVDRWMGNRPSKPDGLPCISVDRYRARFRPRPYGADPGTSDGGTCRGADRRA
jgi:D-amino-acid dehydrogenase